MKTRFKTNAACFPYELLSTISLTRLEGQGDHQDMETNVYMLKQVLFGIALFMSQRYKFLLFLGKILWFLLLSCHDSYDAA